MQRVGTEVTNYYQARQRLSGTPLPPDYSEYFTALRIVLGQLDGQRMGLSLSGLEATAEPVWLMHLLQVVGETSSLWDEKVLYTNGCGFVDDQLLQEFAKASFDRVELSRQHYSEDVNQRIMRFHRNVEIRSNDAYEQVVRRLKSSVQCLKNSCILTATGINSIGEIEAYCRWAANLGVHCVVFRELSRFSNSAYVANPTTKWINKNRVSIEPLLSQVLPEFGQARQGWRYMHSTVGYYYYNEHFSFEGMEVVLEVSSYEALQQCLTAAPDNVDKLIFHFNGNLTTDWDPSSCVVGTYRSETAAAGKAKNSPVSSCDPRLSWSRCCLQSGELRHCGAT